MTVSAVRVVNLDEVHTLTRRAFERVGVATDAAKVVADDLVMSEAEGHPSHGLLRAPQLIRRIEAGLVNAQPGTSVVRDTATTAVIDGDGGLGQVVAAQAMELAITKAREFGLGAVAVRNSSHFGRAGHPAGLAAREEMLGIAASNGSPRLAASEGQRPSVGNNPWAVAWPTADGIRCLDIANSVVAAGKLRKAAADGLSIPENWAINADGEATIDPMEGLRGALLAIGGHKGWGMSVVIDVLAGGLSNGAAGPEVAAVDDMTRLQHSSHFVLALNIESFVRIGDFRAWMDTYAENLRDIGGPSIRLPGERSEHERRRHESEGLRIPVETLAVLESLAGFERD